MISPQLDNVITFLRSERVVSGGGDVPVADMRARFELAGTFFTPPEGVREEPATVGGIPCVWTEPESGPTTRTILYLHGGGYTIGSPRSHRGLIGHLATKARARVLAPDYRLAPENPFPAAVEDAVAVMRALLSDGTDPARLAVAGDSAGGGLSAALLVALRDGNLALPACAVLLSPWTDLEASGATMTTRAEADPMIDPAGVKTSAEWYLAGAPARHPLASPLYADLTGLPPMLIQAGDCEVLLDDAVRLSERAKAVGVDVTLDVWPEMIHVWQFFAGTVPEADDAIARIAEFIAVHIPE